MLRVGRLGVAKNRSDSGGLGGGIARHSWVTTAQHLNLKVRRPDQPPDILRLVFAECRWDRSSRCINTRSSWNSCQWKAPTRFSPILFKYTREALIATLPRRSPTSSLLFRKYGPPSIVSPDDCAGECHPDNVRTIVPSLHMASAYSVMSNAENNNHHGRAPGSRSGLAGLPYATAVNAALITKRTLSILVG